MRCTSTSETAFRNIISRNTGATLRDSSTGAETIRRDARGIGPGIFSRIKTEESLFLSLPRSAWGATECILLTVRRGPTSTMIMTSSRDRRDASTPFDKIMPAPGNDDGGQQVQIASTATSRSGINFNLAGTRSLALQVFGFRCERKSAERRKELAWKRRRTFATSATLRLLSPIFTSVPRWFFRKSRRPLGYACRESRRLPRSLRRAAASLSISSSRRCIVEILRPGYGLYDGGRGESNSRELIYGLIKGRRARARGTA